MNKQIYTNSFGTIDVSVNSELYNGKTINQIESMPFDGWSEHHKEWYLNNCREVISIQLSGHNLGLIECLKRTNFDLVKCYL